MPGSLDEELWAQAYLRALEDQAAKFKDRPLRSIYFGGGTPSLMAPSFLARLLDKITALWPLRDNCEITLEANPASSARDVFESFKLAGINRLSLGVQSLDDRVLSFLGRAHDAKTALEALDAAAQIFPRYSFDLIYGYAGHSLPDWRAQLRQALALKPPHLSLYQLTVEPDTVFGKRQAKGEKLTVDDEQAAYLYEITQDLTEAFGLPSYEVSNHAKPWQESRHNLTYWHYDDYLGIGPGAHGRLKQDDDWLAYENEKKPELWLSLLDGPSKGVSHSELLPAVTAQKEALMMGLRLRRGINKGAWERKFAHPVKETLAKEKIESLIAQGLWEENTTHIRLSAAGRQRLNAVLHYLLFAP